MIGLGLRLGSGLVLVLRYIWQFATYMVSFTYIDLVNTVMAASAAHPASFMYLSTSIFSDIFRVMQIMIT